MKWEGGEEEEKNSSKGAGEGVQESGEGEGIFLVPRKIPIRSTPSSIWMPFTSSSNEVGTCKPAPSIMRFCLPGRCRGSILRARTGFSTPGVHP